MPKAMNVVFMYSKITYPLHDEVGTSQLPVTVNSGVITKTIGDTVNQNLRKINLYSTDLFKTLHFYKNEII